MPKNTIKINKKDYKFEKDETILNVARRNNISIPSLCDHADFCAKENCRVCVVEIKGEHGLSTSCGTKAKSGMEVFTDTYRVEKSRGLNLEMIFAEHIEKCATCIWRFECKLLKYAREYNLLINTFPDRKGKRPVYKFKNAVELDSSQCIDCRNCIDACSILQGIDYLEIKGKGHNQEVAPTSDRRKHCILCGQCALHCPVSAAQEQANWQDVEKEILNDKKTVVVQFAPSIRVSIGEDFGMDYGEIVTEKLVSSLRALGFDFVFDVSYFADITTIVEAEELLERITKKGTLPMMTSCCPGWVNYVEHYNPELIPNLTTARSPQIHGGGVIKTYWANKMGIDPKDIVVVSIMPCTAKKYEASREEMTINNQLPVDYVLTTRELSFMIKKSKIDFVNIKETKADNPLGEYTGAGVIFGGSGGVMESALRTAQYILEGDNAKLSKKRIDFHDVRGLEDIKEAEIDIAGNKVRVGIVNGIKHIKEIIPRLKDFDYIEIMTCPGGCIGGGGQPIPTSRAIVKERIAALYRDDKNKKVRVSAENESAKEILDWLKENNLEHKTLHTRYFKNLD